jgi:hypothetical protein
MIQTLADRVQEAVSEAEKRLPVADIAKACGVSKQSAYAWRRGDTKKLKGETLVELAEVSGINARWIINGKGRKKGVSPDEQLIIDALPHLSQDLRESWIDAARKAIAKTSTSTTARLLEMPPAGETAELILAPQNR